MPNANAESRGLCCGLAYPALSDHGYNLRLSDGIVDPNEQTGRIRCSTSIQMGAEQKPDKSRAPTVAAGILVSRIFGLVRESIALRYFGIGAHTDVLQAAFRFPNILQNLLGEGSISAAFIPVYSRMLAEGRTRDAGRFAGSIFGLLVVVVSTIVLLGIALARPLVSLILFNWRHDAQLVAEGLLTIDRLELTIQAVKFVFPMAGLLVLSAWALGVLNSHRKFFLPYFAPVLWNLAIIAGLVAGAQAFAGESPGSADGMTRILFAGFAGALLGGLLQFLVQLPLVLRESQGLRVRFSTRVEGVRTAIKAFTPAVAGRGVAQVSGYLDLVLASLLAVGAVAALRPALVLYLLPASLFGLSVAASELPSLSRIGDVDIEKIHGRIERIICQSMFLTVPTAVGYIALGFPIIGGLFRSGQFGFADNVLVYAVLAAYSLGLVATTVSRLLQNSFWALGDTATPARMAGVRLVVSVVVAVPLMLVLDRWSVQHVTGFAAKPLYFGAVGLALAASVAAWTEVALLQRRLARRIRLAPVPWKRVAFMTGMSAVCLVPSIALLLVLPGWPAIVRATVLVTCFAGVYILAARWLRSEELAAWMGRLRA